jgi:hypothetical protein
VVRLAPPATLLQQFPWQSNFVANGTGSPVPQERAE